MTGDMRCIFHVSFTHVPDWTEQCESVPSRGAWIDHDGSSYRVMACVKWINDPSTVLVALTDKPKTELDDLEELWRRS